MTKSFIDRYSFSDYEYIGFDIDGTLYDEFSFVSQAYKPIASFLSKKYKIDEKYL